MTDSTIEDMLAWLLTRAGRSIVFHVSNSKHIILEIGRAYGDTTYFYGENYSKSLSADYGSFVDGANFTEAETFIREVLQGNHVIHIMNDKAVVTDIQYDSGCHIGGSKRRPFTFSALPP